MKPIAILKKFFGQLDGQTTIEFLHEMKAFRESDKAGYDWCVSEAAKQIGCEVDNSGAI